MCFPGNVSLRMAGTGYALLGDIFYVRLLDLACAINVSEFSIVHMVNLLPYHQRDFLEVQLAFFQLIRRRTYPELPSMSAKHSQKATSSLSCRQPECFPRGSGAGVP